MKTEVLGDIEYTSEMDVELVAVNGSDQFICDAARVSTLGSEAVDTVESEGLIDFLLRNRHGTPFEHNQMVFRIGAPIFVWREFMRHRIGFSYNEQSGRYMELKPLFYIPDSDRPLQQVGKPGHYEFVAGTQAQFAGMEAHMLNACHSAYERYQKMLKDDIAKEVARMVLPVNIYSYAYVTCNARSLMSFLALRTKSDHSTFPSYPQREIEMVAERMEGYFKGLFPMTWSAFDVNGRVSP